MKKTEGLVPKDKQEIWNKIKHKQLRVWYGFRKLTKTIVKKKSILIIYENDYVKNNERFVKRAMTTILFERFQEPIEKIDALSQIYCLSTYEYFINEKNYQTKLNQMIEDEKFVSQEDLEFIKKQYQEEIEEYITEK